MDILGSSRETLFGQSIDGDSTFGLTPRFFTKRAIFKKTSSNKSGSFGFPKTESDALGLQHNQPVNMAVIKLDTNFVATVRNKQVKQNSRGFFTFNLPSEITQELGGEDMDNLAPLQFVVSKVGVSQPNPANQISPLDNRRRGSYTASKFLVYKSYVAEDDRGSYVNIEPNERDYFGIEAGDTISMTTIPLKNVSPTDTLKRFFNNDINATAEDVSTDAESTSMRIYLDDLPSMFEYEPGTLVQVIGKKI